MALPAGVTLVTNIKGGKGDTGTFAFLTAESVSAETPASAEMVGPPDNRGAHLKIPRGLPGINAVENDEAFATYLAAPDSETGGTARELFYTKDQSPVLATDFVPEGATPAGTHIQAAIDAAEPDGRKVVVPHGEWEVSEPIVLHAGVNLDLASSKLIAVSAFSGGVVQTLYDDLHISGKISGGFIDCNHLASTGVWAGFFREFIIQGTVVHNNAGEGIVLGHPSSSTTSYGGRLISVIVDRPRPHAQPEGSVGLKLYAGDCFILDSVFVGSETGVHVVGPGGNHFKGAHVWSRLPENVTRDAFVIEATSNIFVDCYADTPGRYGFHFTNHRQMLIAPRFYLNSAANPTGVIGVKIDPHVRQFYSQGAMFGAFEGTEWSKDFDYPDHWEFYNTSEISGNTGYRFATNTVIPGDIASYYGSGVINREVKRNGVALWTDRYDADSNYALIARDDSGGFVQNAMFADRVLGHMMFQMGTTVPSSSKLLPGMYSLWIDPADDQVKLSYRRPSGGSVRTFTLGSAS